MQRMGPYLLALAAPDVTLEQAGGKGASLNRLARNGFPVPPGFLITTAAYHTFVEANTLAGQILELSRAVSPDDPATFEEASSRIRRLFAESAIPAELADSIRHAYRELGSGVELPAVAVRSSATAEDLPEASFAGQQETLLNVAGDEALLQAVKTCWSSLWTARAIAYRIRQGIAPDSVGLAVVVQAMVPADTAGILFTANPVTGNRDEVVINAAWGLGEAIAGGQVSPDTLIVDKANGTVKDVAIGDKMVMTVPAATGTSEQPVAPEQRTRQAITNAQAAELARYGRAIEASFGGPQDIEWAIGGGKVAILQARPVTTLQQHAQVPGNDAWPAEGERPTQPFDLWTLADVGERWPEPVTPLTWSVTPKMTNDNMAYSLRGVAPLYLQETQWAKRFYGRVYFNEGAMSRVMSEEFGMPASMMDDALGSGTSEKDGKASGMRIGRFLQVLPTMLRVSGERFKNERIWEESFPQVEEWIIHFLQEDVDRLNDRAILQEIETVWMPRLLAKMDLHGDATSTSMLLLPVLEKMAEGWFGRKELAHDLVTGISGVRSAEMVPALNRLAARIKALGLTQLFLDNSPAEALVQLKARPEALPVVEMLNEFLAEHGHRTAMEAELLYPRWIEQPEQVIESLAGYLRAADQIDSHEAELRQRHRRVEATAEAKARIDPLRWAIFNWMLTRTQNLVRLRDNGQHYLVKLFLPVRHLYAELGKRWASRGWLEQADDIFFLATSEIAAIGNAGDPTVLPRDLRTTIAERREAYRHWFTVKAPDVIGPEGQPVARQRDELAGGTVLQGVPASAGKVRGIARIIAHPQEAGRLGPDAILVTRSTDPGWTPVFPLVKGLVMEIGGQLSHGAIVAREYGIPAVINVHDATSLIEDGRAITVDGSNGRVYLDDVPELTEPSWAEESEPAKPRSRWRPVAGAAIAAGSVLILWRLLRRARR